MTDKKGGSPYAARAQKADANRKRRDAQAAGETVPAQTEQPVETQPTADAPQHPIHPTVDTAKAADKVGLNLRITKERRKYIKGWAVNHDIAMNDLFSLIIDQIETGSYDPLKG